VAIFISLFSLPTKKKVEKKKKGIHFDSMNNVASNSRALIHIFIAFRYHERHEFAFAIGG
jgi:hypothetical protein